MSRWNVHRGKATLGRNMQAIIKENGGIMPLKDLLRDLKEIGMDAGSLRSLILAGSMKVYITVSEDGMVWHTGKRGG